MERRGIVSVGRVDSGAALFAQFIELCEMTRQFSPGPLMRAVLCDVTGRHGLRVGG